MVWSQQLSNNLRNTRKRMGLSQRALAEKLYISAQSVSKWERAEAVPDLEHLCKLSVILHTSVDALLGIRPREEDALIAVDGGGTKTEFVLITLSGRLLKRLVLSGSNPNTCGVKRTCDILCRGIDTLLQEGNPVRGIYVGAAGFYSGDNGARVAEILRKNYSGIPLQCQSDICNVLACSEDPDNAIAVICGTGSVVYATRKGQLLRCGGGGWRLETLGSGYDMGRMAILAALEHRDGTGPETLLTDAVEQKLGASVWNQIQRIYAEDPAYIAAFAPLVIRAWQAQDAVATAIVEKNCQRLAQLVHTASTKSPEAKQVILSGSLLTQCPDFCQLLTSSLDRKLRPYQMEYPQVWGACLRCAALAKLPKPDVNLFLEGYAMEETYDSNRTEKPSHNEFG